LRARRLIDFTRKNDSLFLARMWLYDRGGWKSFLAG
jgi:hypothetical protein